MSIEQAIYGSEAGQGYRFLARSAGFLDSWLGDAERLCMEFGERPAGVRCPLARFACPLRSREVAIVRVADQGMDDAGRPGTMAFHLLVMSRKQYLELEGDLFRIQDAFAVDWQARGALPSLEWTAGPPRRRTVDEVRRILDVVPERTQMLLGGVQVLLDGGKLVFERQQPDEALVREMWMLLPGNSRAELWPATFAFGNKHGFHLAVVADASGSSFAGYVREENAGDYPEGRYEYALQQAAEIGDQEALDALFSRRSRRQMVHLALMLLGVMVLASLLLNPRAEQREPLPEQPERQAREEVPARPSAREYPALSEPERKQLEAELARLGNRLGVALPAGSSEEALRRALQRLDEALTQKRGSEKVQGAAPGEKEAGSLAWHLRVVLWRHGVPEYAEPRLNVVELMERLRQKLVEEKLLREKEDD